MNIAIIPAAGQSCRWGNHLNTVKQLAPINSSGKTVLGRTIEMLRCSGVEEVFVITHNGKIIDSVKNAKIIRPENYTYLSDTILSSQAKWGDRTTVLLGDVFFSQDGFERILNCRDKVKFFGIDRGSEKARMKIKRPEIYAFSFDISMKEKIQKGLQINSFLSKLRDKGDLFLLLCCLKEALTNNSDYLKTLCIASYPPRPPYIFRRLGFKRGLFWRISRLFVTGPRQKVWYGKLWGLYFYTATIDPYGGDDYRWPRNTNDFFEQIDDITQDIDFIKDHDNLMKKLCALNPK